MVSKPCHTTRNSHLINWSKADEHAIIDVIEMAGKIRIWLQDHAAEVAATHFELDLDLDKLWSENPR